MFTDVQLPEYLDAAATTPVHPEVLEAMLPYFTQHFGNANSQHIYGQIAKKAIDDARESIAAHINVLPEEIIFTSGATEAINLAIKGYWEANRDKGNHIITVKTEHKAVLNTCAYLETLGVDVTYLDVDHYGRITNDQLRAAFRPDTILACVMHVNNETGLIQDIHSFAETCAEQDIAFFTDSTQAIGHIETDYSNPAITMACMSAHKIQGPKGIGAIVNHKTTQLGPMAQGISNITFSPNGTPNTPGIVGISTALELATSRMRTVHTSANSLQDEIKNRLSAKSNIKTIIPTNLSAPHILTYMLLDEHAKFIEENAHKFAISNGSACNSGIINGSHVMSALRLPANNLVRFSFL